MPETALDIMIAGTAPDEVSIAAGKLEDILRDRFDQRVEHAQQLMSIELPNNPVEVGLAHVNSLLHRIRNDANTVAQWLLEATTEKQKARARRINAKTAYEEKLHLTLAHNPAIQEVEGQQQKLAHAKELLNREARIVQFSDQIYALVLGYYEALKLAHDTLADTKRDLMSQLAVVKQQIALGEVDGSTFPLMRGGGPPESKNQEAERQIAAELKEATGFIRL